MLGEDYVEILEREAPRLRSPLVFGFGNAVTLEDGRPVVPTFRPGGPAGAWRVDTFCSISLVVSRAALDRIGPFDERFGMGARFPACEETDVLLRIVEAGGRGEYLDRLTIRHPRRARTADLGPRYEAFGYAQGALARKHVRSGVFLARFAYGLVRTVGGVVLGLVRANGLAGVYRASLRGKLRGFRAFPAVGL